MTSRLNAEELVAVYGGNTRDPRTKAAKLFKGVEDVKGRWRGGHILGTSEIRYEDWPTTEEVLKRGTDTLVAQIAGGKALPGDVVDQIVDRADGVPLFIEELTRSVLESGLLREEGDRYVLDRALPPFAIPTSLHASLMARLDRLASVRLVAQTGAAIGREFSNRPLRTPRGSGEYRAVAAAAIPVAACQHAHLGGELCGVRSGPLRMDKTQIGNLIIDGPSSANPGRG